MAVTSAAVRQLSDGNSQGTVLGTGTSDKIAFYNATPITQRTSSAQSAIQATSVSPAASTPTGGNTVWGYSSANQANQIVTLGNELQATLVALGLMKGS